LGTGTYTYYAEAAKKEGYHYIAKIFEETANNERIHAKEEFKLLNGIGDTAANLKAAMDGEDYETTEMYPTFAKEAEEEGNKAAQILFEQIGKIEAHHRDRYKRLLDMVEAGTVFTREQPIEWKCSLCGYVAEGKQPPAKCPGCKHPKEFYEPANLTE